jgi:hypothetical protein
MRWTEKDCCNNEALHTRIIKIGNKKYLVLSLVFKTHKTPNRDKIERSAIPRIDRVQLKAVILLIKSISPKGAFKLDKQTVILAPPRETEERQVFRRYEYHRQRLRLALEVSFQMLDN